jgi:hypothetical protein
MSKPALIHPDYLLDRARHGALPPEDWRRLGAHLAACPACAWERSATDDFAREHAADPDGGIDPTRLALLVDGALARAGLAGLASAVTMGGSPPYPPARAPVRARVPRALARWLAATAMVAAVAAALALPVRDASSEAPSVASTEASLDAGALGAPSGGDS